MISRVDDNGDLLDLRLHWYLLWRMQCIWDFFCDYTATFGRQICEYYEGWRYSLQHLAINWSLCVHRQSSQRWNPPLVHLQWFGVTFRMKVARDYVDFFALKSGLHWFSNYICIWVGSFYCMSSRNLRFCSRNFSCTENRSHQEPIWNCVCQGLFCREHSLNTHFLLQKPLKKIRK